MKNEQRLSKLETHSPYTPMNIDLVMIDCQCQVKSPELFEQIRTGKKVSSGGEVVELKPIDPNWQCTCHMGKVAER